MLNKQVHALLTQWLNAGYSAAPSAQELQVSNTIAAQYMSNPLVPVVQAWLAASVANQQQAALYIHAYWARTFNCQPATVLPVVPQQVAAFIQHCVNSISAMP